MNMFLTNKYLLILAVLLYFSSAVTAEDKSTVVAEDREQILVYAPATPSSIPLIVAAESLPDVKIKLFTSQSQAYALFLNGNVQILSTGLSVGVQFFRQGVPVRIINSYVSGMTYMVTACHSDQITDKPVYTHSKKKTGSTEESFYLNTRDEKKIADCDNFNFNNLRGSTLYLPFIGSPIEEVTRFFILSDGLLWKQDIHIAYGMFPEVVKLLRQKKTCYAILPEPFVSILERYDDDQNNEDAKDKQNTSKSIGSDSHNLINFHVACSYKEMWKKHTGDGDGYPQVGTFVKSDWAKSHSLFIDKFNQALARAIIFVVDNPGQAAKKAAFHMNFSEDILTKALGRTDFHLLQNDSMVQEIKNYYRTTGNSLNETFEKFFNITQ